MKLWTVPAGAGTTRYFVAAYLGANSSVSLVAPAGFTVARWYSGSHPRIVRGQWISPMPDLDPVIHGDALDFDVDEDDELIVIEGTRPR